jgi:hypothetical protein
MRFIKILMAALLLNVAAVNANRYNGALVSPFSETPSKSVIFKDPAAEDAGKYFSGGTTYRMWIFKAGTTGDLEKIIKIFSDDAAVKSCEQGATTGDYSELVLNLKAPENKAWFVALFKKAGLGHVKINNHEAVDTEKL